MTNRRITSLIVIAVSLIITLSMTIYTNKKAAVKSTNSYSEPLVSADKEDNALSSLSDDFTLKSDFSSNLPIVIIDTESIEPPVNTKFNEQTLLYEPIKDIEPFVDGTISVLDNNKRNLLTDNPTSKSKIKIKLRGNTSMKYAKPQYLVKLITETGQDNELSLLGMGTDNEWIINGTMTDKSMMRNYLAYRTASKFLSYTPDALYCEVVIKEKDAYTYQGVYLMGESVKQGLNRVDISKYKATENYNSYMVRRDRYDEEAIMLKTYATQNKLSSGYLGLRYPSKINVNPKMIDYIEKDISKIEKILYSDNSSEFSTYPYYINVDSFIDYFIINEYFGNYDAGNNSTYMYKELGGKLSIGPVWDFDGAVDNFTEKPMNVKALAVQTAPWFDRLTKDKSFVLKLQKRYAQLRRTYLSEENITNDINEIEAYIAPAQEREWARWNEIRSKQDGYALKPYRDAEGDKINREISEYDQDVFKLKTILRKHGNEIPKSLQALGQVATKETDWTSRTNLILLFVVALFCIPIIYVSRE
ncbi:CotH kinase family protein [Clostridium lacusfryxellense]|uniref:CotH kinase family protein n=1 Tax=Clostridium lacusfryxellense TaxID=205328 RepID=UPI001C0E7965|nr:CotH kinase family protein [Clostridium lacusfryxellense]MBU3114090.1 CotH kinase family protein [Clostridium lacusfryxellense]